MQSTKHQTKTEYYTSHDVKQESQLSNHMPAINVGVHYIYGKCTSFSTMRLHSAVFQVKPKTSRLAEKFRLSRI